jgi:hypothetical protein
MTSNDGNRSLIIVTMATLLLWFTGAFDNERENRNWKRRERYEGLPVVAKCRRVRKIPRVGTVAPKDAP